MFSVSSAGVRTISLSLLSGNICCLVIFVVKLFEVVDALTTLLLHRREYCARVKYSCRSFLADFVPESVLKPSCSRFLFATRMKVVDYFKRKTQLIIPIMLCFLLNQEWFKFGNVQICDFVSAMFSAACWALFPDQTFQKRSTKCRINWTKSCAFAPHVIVFLMVRTALAWSLPIHHSQFLLPMIKCLSLFGYLHSSTGPLTKCLHIVVSFCDVSVEMKSMSYCLCARILVYWEG